MKKSVKKVLILISIVPGVILSYILLAILISYIPVNRDFKESVDGVEIFIKSNGVHTDIVTPVHSALINWEEKIDPKNFKKGSEP